MNRLFRGLQGKLAISLIGMLLAIVVSITSIIAVQYRSRMEKVYSAQAFNMASFAARILDAEKIKTYYKTGVKDAYYEEMRQFLLRAKKSFEIKYFYVVVPEKDQMVYIWDAGEPGEEGICNLLDRDDYYGGGNENMHRAFAKDAPQTILVTRNEEYGYLASAYVAILDKAGIPVALASVDVSMDMLDARINQMIAASAGFAIAVLLICLAVYWCYVRRVVIDPLDLLAGAARNFMSERARSEELILSKVSIASKDEIGELYQAMSKMEVEMMNYLEDLKVATAERERVGAELSVATRIQAEMLPLTFPAFPDRKDFDIFATMTPAREVGGDFYDFFLVDDSHLAMVIADVSGKGVPAALFMVNARTLIKSRTLAGGTPAQILADVNNLLCEGNAAQLFVTVWIAILDLKTGRGLAANAGHEHPVLKRKDGAFEYVKYRHSPALAAMPGMKFAEHAFELQPGDTLFVYTDGVQEATDAAQTLYGFDRLLTTLNVLKDCKLEDLLHGVKADIDAFTGDAPQFDDITMLAVNYTGN